MTYRKPAGVALCIASRGDCRIEWAHALGNMLILTMQSHPFESLKCGLIISSGTYLAKNREELAEAALRQDVITHVMYLDDDMKIPPELLIGLLEHDVPIVGVNYPMRRMPLEPTAIKYVGYDGVHEPTRVVTTPESTGLEEVEALGFGGVLIKREVFENMEQPWFEQYYDHDLGLWVGEDVYFCRRALKAGYKSYVDHDLSQTVEHYGIIGFRNEHAYALGMASMLAHEEKDNGTGHICESEDCDCGLVGSG